MGSSPHRPLRRRVRGYLTRLTIAAGLATPLGCEARDRTQDETLPSTGSTSKPAGPVRAAKPDPSRVAIVDPAEVDILATHLEVDLERHRGRARIEVATSKSASSFEVADLKIESVSVDGEPATIRREGTTLHVALPKADGPVAVTIDYAYRLRDEPKGAYEGLTLTWPYHCGRVFPCQSDPADGMRFDLEVTGVPEGQRAIHPRGQVSEAPPYMLAWAVGDYESLALGSTSAGTRIFAHFPERARADAKKGTPHLVDAFDFLERTYGPYAYGNEVATVWVDWGQGGYGGMEHHPTWHVSAKDFGYETVHVHEAAHGWFGNAVRIACWEDFVLSEALASYLAARALEDAGGPKMAREVWAEYQRDLDDLDGSAKADKGWPEGCGTHDVIEDDIFSQAPYMRGAFFFRALEARVGRTALDASLRKFYLARRGTAARFDELLDALAEDTGYDAHTCAEAWLRRAKHPPQIRCD